MNRIVKVLAVVTAANFLVASSVMAHSTTELPPAGYDHPAAQMRVWSYSVAKVDDLCGRLVTHKQNPYRVARTGTMFGCAIGGVKQCILIMPKKSGMSTVSYDRLYRHERAHCNGWHHA